MKKLKSVLNGLCVIKMAIEPIPVEGDWSDVCGYVAEDFKPFQLHEAKPGDDKTLKRILSQMHTGTVRL